MSAVGRLGTSPLLILLGLPLVLLAQGEATATPNSARALSPQSKTGMFFPPVRPSEVQVRRRSLIDLDSQGTSSRTIALLWPSRSATAPGPLPWSCVRPPQ
jgi:hypothetical protein